MFTIKIVYYKVAPYVYDNNDVNHLEGQLRSSN